jgi:hypothetical protein
VLIKYKINEEFVEVNVKKCGRPSQQNPISKKYTGSMLINEVKLEDIWDFLPYIP